MDIKELQKKIMEADKVRGWDISFLSQTFTHLMEEIGEIGRHILFRDQYKSRTIAKEVDDYKFGEELVDAMIFIFKIANTQGIKLNEIIQKKVNKDWNERFPIKKCLKDSNDYIQRQQKILNEFRTRLKLVAK